MTNAEKSRGFVEAHPAVRRRREVETISQVRADPAVREQPAVLKDIADTARLGRQIGRAVEQGALADADMPAIGAEQPGDHIEDARLAGARRAEQRGEPRSGGEVRGEDPVAAAAGVHGRAARRERGGAYG